MRDHSPPPIVDRNDKCRWPYVRELACRAAVTAQVGDPSVKIAKRIRKISDAICNFQALTNADFLTSRVVTCPVGRSGSRIACYHGRNIRMVCKERYFPWPD